jgi:sigma-54 dependent transcriptional regulator, acetoin dehydrogenase operon transcriptional activator AcoR
VYFSGRGVLARGAANRAHRLCPGDSMDWDRQDGLRRALETLTHDGSLPNAVRVDIGDSWRRSLDSGLIPDYFDVHPARYYDPDSKLARAARPTFSTLGDELANVGISMILADDCGQVVLRHVTEKSLMVGLDRILLAPGFDYSEHGVGTNGIGTALEQHAPTFVVGAEHFAERLVDWACAGAPILDPRSGRTLGVIDLTCWERDSSPLMLTLARRAAAEISQRLFDDSGPMLPAALRHLLQERGRTSAVAFVADGRVMVNAAADRMICNADEPTLWFIASEALGRKRPQTVSVTLSSGRAVTMRCEPVMEGSNTFGALVRLSPPSEDEPHSRRAKDAPAFGWDSLTDAERMVANLASRGMTNREIGAELFMSHRTVGSHLYRIYPKLGVTSRVGLTRRVLEHGDLAPTDEPPRD